MVSILSMITILISNICWVLDSHICSYHCFPMYHPLICIETSYLWNSTYDVRPGTRYLPYPTPYCYTILKLKYVHFIFLTSWESAVLDTVFFDIETAVEFTSLYRSDPSLLLVAVTFSLYIHIYTYITDHSKIRQPGRLMWPKSFISLRIQMYY